jgi:hypothetical protein
MADNGNPAVAPPWWRRVFKWGGILISGLAVAADLTADLPVSLPRWLSWLSAVPEPAYDIVFLLGLLLAAYFFARERRGMRRLERELEHEQRERRRLEEEAAQVVHIDIEPELEPEAPREGIERLREVYSYCGADIRLARELLERICQTAFVDGGDKGLMARLMQDWIVDHCLIKEEALSQHMNDLKPGIGQSQFRALLQQFRDTFIGNFVVLSTWIRHGGVSILGEQLFFSASYKNLYQHHERTLEELRRAATRTDIGEIAAGLQLVEWKLVPPRSTPSEGPHTSTASGQSPPP